MKTSIVTLATADVIMRSANAFATGNLIPLSDSDWTAIEQEAELDNMLAIDHIPALHFTEVNVNWEVIEEEAQLERMLEHVNEALPALNQALVLNLHQGRDAVMTLNAPYNDADQVGLVVLDENGNIVYRSTGTFQKLKTLRFQPLTQASATYVVLIYSAERLFETKLQIVTL